MRALFSTNNGDMKNQLEEPIHLDFEGPNSKELLQYDTRRLRTLEGCCHVGSECTSPLGHLGSSPRGTHVAVHVTVDGSKPAGGIFYYAQPRLPTFRGASLGVVVE